jgi:hypothetical protein
MNIIPIQEDGTKELFRKRPFTDHPENAVEYLESLEWYVYGGSFFESTGTFGQGKLNISL